MTTDDTGRLYLGGSVTQAFSSTTTLNSGIPAWENTSMIVGINPVIEGNLVDFMKATSGSNQPEYPDDLVYTMAYNNGKLYIAGAFQKIANITSTNFPIAAYDFSTQLWGNALRSNNDDTLDPDQAVTKLSFDNMHNKLFVSGFFDRISNFVNPVPYSYTVNSCSANGSIYTCGNNSANGDYVNLGYDNSISYPVPALTIEFVGNMFYVAGGFSQVNNLFTSTSKYLIATFSNAWTALSVPSVNNAAPDGVVYSMAAYTTGFYAGGGFTTIGTIPGDVNDGDCGADADKACLLAKYDNASGQWHKFFNTNGFIETVVISAKIEVN